MAKLTLLSNIKGNASFQSRWGIIYHKDEPEEIPVSWAVCYMKDSDYQIDFESGDLAKKVVESVAALIPKKVEESTVEIPIEEPPVVEPSSDE